MPDYYPIFLNIEGRICLVVGGGSVGARKAAELLLAGALVRLVSLELGRAAEELAERPNVELVLEPYRPEHLDSAVLVFAATDSPAVNALVVEDARKRNIPVNSADAPDTGNFIVPAVVRRGRLCIGISTGGASPMLAARIRSQLESQYGVEYAAYVELLNDMRSYIKSLTKEPTSRSTALEALLDAEAKLRATLLDAGREEARAEAERLVNESASQLHAKALE